MFLDALYSPSYSVSYPALNNPTLGRPLSIVEGYDIPEQEGSKSRVQLILARRTDLDDPDNLFLYDHPC